MNWSSRRQTWDVETSVNEKVKHTLQGKFIIGGTGFFDYKTPRAASIPGLSTFQGPVLHPQFWPNDVNYTYKNVLIFGSGAIAITMLPAIAKQAHTSTMLQRSPTYIMSMSMHSLLDDFIRRWIKPEHLADRIIAWRFTILAWLFLRILLLRRQV
ncbi:putative flavin monooxygenase, FAD/NAD(P)-binding domain superfamily [Septoria linicola]|nr:putative flavin monooxygenase, FAD/NAD(P)-binding domain superfamily [Septoria linicola]